MKNAQIHRPVVGRTAGLTPTGSYQLEYHVAYRPIPCSPVWRIDRSKHDHSL